MALEDVLAGLPVRGEYLAQQQFDQRQAIGLLGMLRAQQQMRLQQDEERRIQEMQPLRMDLLRAQVARQNEDTRLRTELDQRQKDALLSMEGFLKAKYPGTPAQMDAADNVMTPEKQAPEVGLFKAAAALDPRNATDLALSLAGMKQANGGKGVDPMIQRNIGLRDQLRARADAVEAQDPALAARLRADADKVQSVIDFEASKGDRAQQDLDRKAVKLYDETGQRPRPSGTPQAPQTTAGDLQFPSNGRATGPAAAALQREAGTEGDMSRESSIRGAVGTPELPAKAGRDVEVARQKELLKVNTKQYDEFRDKIPALNATVRSLDRLQQLADSGQTFSNAGADFKMQLSNIAQALRIKINVDELASSELARQQLAELLKARLGSKDYGSGNAVSNLDLIAAREPLPDLIKSPEGQKKIIRALAQDARESLEDIKAFRSRFESNRGDMTGFRFPSEQRTEERLKAIERNPRASSGQIRQGGGIQFLGFE